MSKSVSIILPCLNEKKNISIIYKNICNNFKQKNYEIIFVDDSSTDGSREEILKISKIDKKVNYIFRKKKRDLSCSFIDGAFISNANYLILMDSDLQHDAIDLKKFFIEAEKLKLDMVIGSRFLKKSNNNTNSYYYLIRLFLSKILIKFINLITNTKLSDPLSGFFLVKKNLVIKYKKEFFSSGFKIMLDIYLSRINKLKTKEIAITLNERKNGHSKINFGILTKIIQLIFYHFFRKHLKKIKELV